MAIAMAVKNQRCQPPASARKLNAAPELCIRTRLKKGVTSRTSPGAKALSTHALVARSAATTARLAASQRFQPFALASRMLACLARAFEVADAPGANGGVARVGTDVGAPMPAALALTVRARHHVDGEFAHARRLANARRRGDEDELEVFSERAQESEVVA